MGVVMDCMSSNSITPTGIKDVIPPDILPEEYSIKVTSDETLRESNPFIIEKFPRTYKRGSVIISTF